MKKNNIKDLTIKIEAIIQEIDSLDFSFFDENNQIDFDSVKEGAVVSLDELEEISERDVALREAIGTGA
tara:strand:+ start:412 stop:618 length:207 start_codon:yes stop_codon:yes gene_type:complete